MSAFRMRRLGIGFQQQVWIGRDRVDFLIGERLIIEIDSTSFDDRAADAKRDARLGILGYRVLRFDYDMVVNHWNLVRDAVLAALSRGDHHRLIARSDPFRRPADPTVPPPPAAPAAHPHPSSGRLNPVSRTFRRQRPRMPMD